MALLEYENELVFIGPDEYDYDWYKAMILGLPTKDLIRKHQELQDYLEKLRSEEPPKKRKNLDAYRGWVELTHNYRDLLNDIAIRDGRSKTFKLYYCSRYLLYRQAGPALAL